MSFWESSIFQNTIFFIGGAFITIFFFFLQKTRVKLEFSIFPTKLISCPSNVSNLTVTFYGQQIDNLSFTEITFRNAGNQNIESCDFAEAEPLQILAGQFFDLDKPPTIKSDNAASRFTAKFLSDKVLQINFDYIKPKQSFTLAFFHKGSAYVSGELKTGQIKNRTFRPRRKMSEDIKNYLVIFLSIIFLAIALFLMSGQNFT